MKKILTDVEKRLKLYECTPRTHIYASHWEEKLKKPLLLIIAIGFLFGCAGIKRGVQDNLFYSSSNPKMKILINPEFKYAERKNDTDFALNQTGILSKVAITKSETYSFLNRDSNRLIEILIQKFTDSPFGWSRSSWGTDYFRDVENKIESGDIMINGKKYGYCVTVQEISLGYCMLNKTLCKIVSAKNDCRICISYSQYIEDYSICDEWNDNFFTNSEIAYYKSFIADSEKDIQILEYKAPTSTPSKGKWGALSFTSHRG